MRISSAELLRDASLQLKEFVMPALEAGDAAERVHFIIMMLDRLSGQMQLLPGEARGVMQEYQATLSHLLSLSHDHGTGIEQAALLPADADPYDMLSVLRAKSVEFIKGLGADIPALPDVGSPVNERDKYLHRLLHIDSHWRKSYNDVLTKQLTGHEVSRKKSFQGATVHDRITRETMTEYIRHNIPNAENVEVVNVKILPGGRSKYTIFISIRGSKELPEELVMRQDTGKAGIPTSVVDEFPILESAYAAGLPVAKPYYLEANKTALGGPFMLVGKLNGQAPGDYFSFPGGSRKLVESLAVTLGRMHTIDPSTIELPASHGQDHKAYMLNQIAYYRRQWEENALEPSPIIEYAFAWLDKECRAEFGGPALVHGDIAPHNYLAIGDELTGIVDWEFAHIGDPAEDLAYRRQFFEQFMPWDDFLKLYYAQGAAPINERRMRMFTVWGLVRNFAFGAMNHRRYQEGIDLDFADAALSTFLYDFFDLEVARELSI